MTCTANSGRSLRHKPAVLLSTVVLFLAVLTSCSCALSSTQPHPSGTVTLDAKTIEALTRMAGAVHKHLVLPGQASCIAFCCCCVRMHMQRLLACACMSLNQLTTMTATVQPAQEQPLSATVWQDPLMYVFVQCWHAHACTAALHWAHEHRLHLRGSYPDPLKE